MKLGRVIQVKQVETKFLEPKIFWALALNFFGPNIFLNPIFFWTQNLRPQTFLGPTFLDIRFLDLNINEPFLFNLI